MELVGEVMDVNREGAGWFERGIIYTRAFMGGGALDLMVKKKKKKKKKNVWIVDGGWCG